MWYSPNFDIPWDNSWKTIDQNISSHNYFVAWQIFVGLQEQQHQPTHQNITKGMCTTRVKIDTKAKLKEWGPCENWNCKFLSGMT